MEMKPAKSRLDQSSKAYIEEKFIAWLEDLRLKPTIIKGREYEDDFSPADDKVAPQIARKFLEKRMDLKVVINDFVNCIMANWNGVIPDITLNGVNVSIADNLLISDVDPLIIYVIAYVFYPKIQLVDADGETTEGHSHGRLAPYYLHALKSHVKPQFDAKHRKVQTEALLQMLFCLKKLGNLLNSKRIVRSTMVQNVKKTASTEAITVKTTINPISEAKNGDLDIQYTFDGKLPDDRTSLDIGRYYYCTSFWTFMIENLNFCELTITYVLNRGKEGKWMYKLRNCLVSLALERANLFDVVETGTEESQNAAILAPIESNEMNFFSFESLAWLLASQNVSIMSTCSQIWSLPKKFIDLGRVLNLLCFTMFEEIEIFENARTSFKSRQSKLADELSKNNKGFFHSYLKKMSWNSALESDTNYELSTKLDTLSSQKNKPEATEKIKKETHAMWLKTYQELNRFEFSDLFKTRKSLVIKLKLRLNVALLDDASTKDDPNRGNQFIATLLANISEAGSKNTVRVTVKLVNETNDDQKERSSKDEDEEMGFYRSGFESWDKDNKDEEYGKSKKRKQR